MKRKVVAGTIFRLGLGPTLVVALLILMGMGVTRASASFDLGVAAGEVTSTSARLWAHASASGPVMVEVSQHMNFLGDATSTSGMADSANDNTVQIDVTGLTPDRVHFYRFSMGTEQSRVGSFRTAPDAERRRTITFGLTGDADAQPDPMTMLPAFNNFEVYSAMVAEHNFFNINLGDTIYSDSEVPNTPVALSVADKWAKYVQNLSLAPLPDVRSATGIYSQPDDHEWINDFSVPEFGVTLYNDGVKAFTDYAPVSYSPTTGFYRHFRWGKNLEIFIPDERSFRDAKASDGGTCDNPSGSGSPDLAPTAPQAIRNKFAALIPSLRTPPPQACLDRINDPGRTLLGTAQLAQLKTDLLASTAVWKVIVNEVPIQQFYALPYDRWEGYAAERLDLINFLMTNVPNAVFLTTDTHADMVNDVRLQTLEPGGPINSGIMEFITGPVATGTFAKEIDAAVGNPAAGALINTAFLKPQPPNGPGLICSSLDVFSYAEVRVTYRRFIVKLRDANRRFVVDPDGPCRTFRLRAS
jgi:alkaline phosphatase D